MKQKVIDRRIEISQFLQREGEVTVSEMAERFHVTTETIRGDFLALSEEFNWIRTHGGLKLNVQKETPKHYIYYDREVCNLKEKKEICYKAITLIENGDCIFVDSGSTVISLLIYLNLKRNLTIITHNIAFLICYIVDGYEEIFKECGHKLLFLGGEVDAGIRLTHGTFFTDNVENLFCDSFFFSVDGIDLVAGATNMDTQAYSSARIAFSHCRNKILLVDESKFQKQGIFSVAKLGELTHLVTNRELNQEWKMSLQDNQVMLLTTY